MLNPIAMPFRLNLRPARDFALPGHAVIGVDGLDAGVFLQSQCMNDVNALTPGTWQYNGWLNPQGRVLALFYLARLASGAYLIILPGGDPSALVENLRRFVFRAKVRIEHIEEWHACGSIAGEGPAKADVLSEDADRHSLRIPGQHWQRTLHVSTRRFAPDAAAAEAWHALDMAIGWPWLQASQLGRWTPQMLGLQRLSAFSLKKGCYPGQEIVARTHYLGKSKRDLLTVCGTGLQAGHTLQAGAQEIGTVVDAAAAGDWGVAVLPAPADDGMALSNPAGRVDVATIEIC